MYIEPLEPEILPDSLEDDEIDYFYRFVHDWENTHLITDTWCEDSLPVVKVQGLSWETRREVLYPRVIDGVLCAPDGIYRTQQDTIVVSSLSVTLPSDEGQVLVRIWASRVGNKAAGIPAMRWYRYWFCRKADDAWQLFSSVDEETQRFAERLQLEIAFAQLM